MMRPMMLWVAVLAAVFGAASSAAAVNWWMPLREVRAQSYVAPNGEAVPRYQWRFIADQRDRLTCVLVLTDTTTGAFAITAVPPDACQ